MTETRQTVFRQTKEEFEQLKNDAYEHKMNISDYLRYLVAKERELTNEIERIRREKEHLEIQRIVKEEFEEFKKFLLENKNEGNSLL